MSMPQQKFEIPSHVPKELVRPWALARAASGDDPYDVIIPRIHEGPEAFYALNCHSQGMPAWVFRRADDIRAVYLDTGSFSSRGQSAVSRMIGEDWDVLPIESDPPVHTAYRTLLNPLLSPNRLKKLEESTRKIAHDLIERFADKGRCDFIADFAIPFPVTVFMALMGLPFEKTDQFLDWEHAMLHATDMPPRERAVRSMKNYLMDAIEERRKRPEDDFLTYIVQGEIEGRKLSDRELLGIAVNLFLGGLDTVTSAVGWHFRHLARHPEQQARLRTEPGFIPTALEELLRAFANVTTHRVCVKEAEIRGVQIKPGDLVAVSTPLACRDPASYENPNEVVLDRAPTHITFAYGPHRCIGSHLARRELLIALEEFLGRIGAFELAPNAKTPLHLGEVMGLDALPLVWSN